jgi:hypothetical protein
MPENPGLSSPGMNGIAYKDNGANNLKYQGMVIEDIVRLGGKTAG